MIFFRKFLVRIRKEYNTQRRRLFILSGISTVVFILIGCVLDWILPFSGLFNVVRSIVLIPTAISMFVLMYSISLVFHYAREAANKDWVPYRLRFSPTWRRRISAVVGAVMIVLVYANGFRIGYTAVSSLFVAVALALLTFMRTTNDENTREKLNLPDSRDLKYQQHMEKLADQRAAREERKRREKQQKHDKRFGRTSKNE